MKNLTWITAVMICFTAVPALSQITHEIYGEGSIVPHSLTEEIDADIAALMNVRGRVFGFHEWMAQTGTVEKLYFAGDTKAFSRFLALCSKLKPMSVRLVIQPYNPPSSLGFSGLRTDKHFDWSFERVLPPGSDLPETMTVQVWPSGGIEVDKLEFHNLWVHDELTREKNRPASFGIYLHIEKRSPEIALTANFPRQALQDKPLITLDDIVSYRWKDHTMTLKPEAVNKLPKPGVEGIPFVIMINDRMQYRGAFMTSESSSIFHSPVIVVDRDPDGDPNTIRIDRVYPLQLMEKAEYDPRDNPWIKASFEKAERLR